MTETLTEPATLLGAYPAHSSQEFSDTLRVETVLLACPVGDTRLFTAGADEVTVVKSDLAYYISSPRMVTAIADYPDSPHRLDLAFDTARLVVNLTSGPYSEDQP